MRYLCHVAYRGNNYVGFQSQINGLAIQDVIQEQLEVIFKEKITDNASKYDVRKQIFFPLNER